MALGSESIIAVRGRQGVGSIVLQISMLNWTRLQSGRTGSGDRGRKNMASIAKLPWCIWLEFEMRSAAVRCRLVYFILSSIHRATLCVLCCWLLQGCLHAVATLDGHAGVARRRTGIVRCAWVF